MTQYKMDTHEDRVNLVRSLAIENITHIDDEYQVVGFLSSSYHGRPSEETILFNDTLPKIANYACLLKQRDEHIRTLDMMGFITDAYVYQAYIDKESKSVKIQLIK